MVSNMTVDAPDLPPVVLIHGLWMTPQSWDGWAARFRARGHVVHTPAWPGMDKPVDALRADPSPMAGLGFARIAGHLEGVVRGLDAAPIIMGHSFGGAFTQVLLDRGLGVAGVAIDPPRPKASTRCRSRRCGRASPCWGARATASARSA